MYCTLCTFGCYHFHQLLVSNHKPVSIPQNPLPGSNETKQKCCANNDKEQSYQHVAKT